MQKDKNNKSYLIFEVKIQKFLLKHGNSIIFLKKILFMQIHNDELHKYCFFMFM